MISDSLKGIRNLSGDVAAVSSTSRKSGSNVNFAKIMSQAVANNSFSDKRPGTASVRQNPGGIAEKSDKVEKDNSQNISLNDKASKVESKDSDSSKKIDTKKTENRQKTDKAAAEVKDYVKDRLGVSDEDLENAMDELGITMLDLLQGNGLVDLIVKLTGSEDVVSVITDSDLSEMLRDISSFISDALSNNNLAKEDIAAVSEDVLPVDEEQASKVSVSEANEESVDDSNHDVASALAEKITVEKSGRGSESRNDSHGMMNNNDAHSSADLSQNLAQSIQNAFVSEYVEELTQSKAVDVVKQVVSAVKVISADSVKSIEFQLNPENLGKINLTVSARNGMITAEIVTQNEQVKRAIEGQMTLLKENLEEQGIKIDAVEVVVQSHQFEAGQNLSKEDSNADESKKGKKAIDLSDFGFEENAAESDSAEDNVIRENSSVEYTA